MAKSNLAKSSRRPSDNPSSTVADANVFKLPEFVRADWATRFLPTLFHCFGSCVDPWEMFTKGDQMLKIIQKLVNTVYPNNNYCAKWGDQICFAV
jgi:hypothetical protein